MKTNKKPSGDLIDLRPSSKLKEAIRKGEELRTNKWKKDSDLNNEECCWNEEKKEWYECETIGNNNTVVGHFATSLAGDNSIVLGAGAYSVASNQLAIGSSSSPVGTFTTYAGAAAEYWDVYINGQTKRIMLAP